MRDIIITDEDRLDPSADLTPVPIPHKYWQQILTTRSECGLFISAGKTVPNVMTAHQCALGSFWNRHVFILPVKKSKFTHGVISQTKTFAVSVPVKSKHTELALCDRLSGFQVNKFEELNLHPARCRKIPCYAVAECGLFLECRVICETDTSDGQIDARLHDDMYPDGDYHTMYFAEIIDIYENE